MERELAVLLQGLKGKQEIDSASVNEQELLRKARYHRISQNFRTEGAFSPDFENEIKLDTRRNGMRMVALSQELTRLARLFQLNGIPFLCLKGPAVGLKVYGDVGARISKDMDLLVEEEMLEATHSMLLDAGYELTTRPEIDGELDKVRGHHIEYVHKERKYIVELHWRLFPNIVNEPSFEELWDERGFVEIGGVQIPCLADEELFIYLVVHGSKHAFFRLRWLYDLHLFLQQKLNYREIADLAGKREAADMLGQTLLLLKELFQTPIPEGLEYVMRSKKSISMATLAQSIIKREYEQGLDVLTMSHYVEWKRYYILIRSGEKRWEFLAHHFLPNQADVDLVRLPKPLYFLYGPLRPMTWMIRRVKKKREAGARAR